MNIPHYLLDYLEPPDLAVALSFRIERAVKKAEGGGLFPFVLQPPAFISMMREPAKMQDAWTTFVESQVTAIYGLTTGVRPFDGGGNGSVVSRMDLTSPPRNYHAMLDIVKAWNTRIKRCLECNKPVETGGRILALNIAPDQKTCTYCYILNDIYLDGCGVDARLGDREPDFTIPITCRVLCSDSARLFGQMLLTAAHL